VITDRELNMEQSEVTPTVFKTRLFGISFTEIYYVY
jgi:hypothetical protein